MRLMRIRRTSMIRSCTISSRSALQQQLFTNEQKQEINLNKDPNEVPMKRTGTHFDN